MMNHDATYSTQCMDLYSVFKQNGDSGEWPGYAELDSEDLHPLPCRLDLVLYVFVVTGTFN